jgi:hypothetical protein
MLIDLSFQGGKVSLLLIRSKRERRGREPKAFSLWFSGVAGKPTVNKFYTGFDAICLSRLRQTEGYFRSVANGTGT